MTPPGSAARPLADQDADTPGPRREPAAQASSSTLLLRLVHAIRDVSRLDALLAEGIRATAATVGASYAVFWQIDQVAMTATAVMRYRHGQILRAPDGAAGESATIMLRDRLDLQAVAAADAPIQRTNVADYPASASYRAGLQAQGIQAVMLAPVSVDHAVVGCLEYHSVHGPFSDQQLALAHDGAAHVSLAMSVTALAERSQQTAVLEARLHQLEAQVALAAQRNAVLQRSLAELVDEPNLDWFLGATLQTIVQQVGAVVGDILIFDPATNLLTHTTAVRDGQAYARTAEVDPDLFQQPFPADINAAFAHLCRTRALVLLSSGQHDLFWPGMEDWHRAQGNTEAAAVALMAGQQPLGVLGVAFRTDAPLTREQKQSIHSAANQVTLAIQLSLLTERSRQAAMLEERARLARDMHDTLAQGLLGIIVQLRASTDPYITDPRDRAEHVATALQLAIDSLEQARRSVHALRAPELAHSDLAHAVAAFVYQRSLQTDTQLRCTVHGDPIPLSAELEDHLLRVAQEAVSNALAHARASQITVDLVFEPAAIRLAVVDDGVGFDSAQPHPGHYGLLGMRERAARVGGALAIHSAPGQGTTLTLAIAAPSDQPPESRP